MYEFKTPPFSHQERALRAGRGRAGFAYLMEMGTGKTKVMIDEAGSLFAESLVDAMVIFCPKSVMRTWVRELEIHLGTEYEVALWTSSPNRAQRDAMERIATGAFTGLGVLVVNIEALSAGTKAMDLVKRVCHTCRTYLAVDESQTVKSPSSKRTKNLMKIGSLAVYRRIASGSPAPNSPMDLYSQLEFIEPGCTRQRSFYGFRSRYAVLQEKVFGGRKVQIEVGYRNVDELRDIVDRHSFRVRKDECLDLPEKIYSRREVEMTREQSRAYSAMRDEALAEIGDSFSSSQAAITTLIRLQQILCGYIRDDDGEVHHLPSNRVQALVDIAESTKEDIVIWVGQHTPMIPVIEAELQRVFGKNSTARFYGGNADTRDWDATRFVSEDGCRFMIATQAAGARGNTWINATQMVYFANTYNLEERMQSEDRSHRAGQTQHVTYTDLVVDSTADERLIRALVRKESISAALMGESPREWM